MFDRLDELVEKLAAIQEELSQPDVVNDQERFKKLMKEEAMYYILVCDEGAE